MALQPATGGVFVVEIVAPADPGTSSDLPGTTAPTTQRRVLWDRKADGGFPETKELKRRVRDVIEPGRDLGHVDRDHHRGIKPLAPRPPAELTAGVQGRLDEANRRRAEGARNAAAGGQGEAGEAAAAETGKGAGMGPGEVCEDCA